MARSKVRRSLSVDGDVSRELDQLAEACGLSSSALATQLIRDGLMARRRKIAESLTYAGIGTAALTALVTLATLLA